MSDTLAGDADRLIFKPELLRRVGLSYTSIWKLMRQGRFPRSFAVSDGRVAWRESEVNAWIDGLSRQRLKGDMAEEA